MVDCNGIKQKVTEWQNTSTAEESEGGTYVTKDEWDNLVSIYEENGVPGEGVCEENFLPMNQGNLYYDEKDGNAWGNFLNLFTLDFMAQAEALNGKPTFKVDISKLKNFQIQKVDYTKSNMKDHGGQHFQFSGETQNGEKISIIFSIYTDIGTGNQSYKLEVSVDDKKVKPDDATALVQTLINYINTTQDYKSNPLTFSKYAKISNFIESLILPEEISLWNRVKFFADPANPPEGSGFISEAAAEKKIAEAEEKKIAEKAKKD